MRRFVVGTAGHVDHGKTTLVRALTGVDTDRSPEEKRRGITIELGFAPWDLGDGLVASVIDVPGHRRFVHTMIAGASGVEAVLLVIAADEGVMPQTREHVAVCELVGATRAVVALTKIDRAEPELAALAEAEARALLAGRLEAEVVRCSAATGEGLDALREAMRRALRSLPPRAAAGARAHARLPVDRVLRVRGAGTVVTGTLIEGRIAVGAPLRIVGARGAIETHARGVEVHGQAVEAVDAPSRVAINLGGVAAEAVRRGDVVTSDPHLAPRDLVDAALRGDADVRRGMELTMHAGTARAPARVDRIVDVDGARVARLRLTEPIVLAGGDPFVLRGSDLLAPSGAVRGGGRVLDVAPPRRRAIAVLAPLIADDPVALVRALVDDAAPRPVPRGGLARRFAVREAAIVEAADRQARQGELVRLGDHGWMRRAALAELTREARARVADHLRRAPLDRGMPLETLRAQLASRAGEAAAEEAIRAASARRSPDDHDAITIAGDVVTGGSRAASVDAALARALEAAKRAIRDAGAHGVSEHGVGEATGAKAADVRAILAKLVRDGDAVHAGDLWFARELVDEMRRRAVARLAEKERMTVIDFKEVSGLARKQAILLLEHFDRAGLTRREGDARVLASGEERDKREGRA